MQTIFADHLCRPFLQTIFADHFCRPFLQTIFCRPPLLYKTKTRQILEEPRLRVTTTRGITVTTTVISFISYHHPINNCPYHHPMDDGHYDCHSSCLFLITILWITVIMIAIPLVCDCHIISIAIETLCKE